MPNQNRRLPFADRFWSKVEKSEGCWTWNGALQTNGYGKIYAGPSPGSAKRGSAVMAAHRASWVLHFGEIGDGLSVLHRCDNPLCVRPDHLFLGDHAANMRDCAAKGRTRTIGHAMQTKCRKGHPYVDGNVVIARGYRRCLICFESMKTRRAQRRGAA